MVWRRGQGINMGCAGGALKRRRMPHIAGRRRVRHCYR